MKVKSSEQQAKLPCPECGKLMRNKRALNGHLWLAHQKRLGWKFELTQKVQKLEAQLQQEREVRASHGQVEFSYEHTACLVCGQPVSSHLQELRCHNSEGKPSLWSALWICPRYAKTRAIDMVL